MRASWSWYDTAGMRPRASFPSGLVTGVSGSAASVGAWATSACSRTRKGCKSTAGTTRRSSGTPDPGAWEGGTVQTSSCGPRGPGTALCPDGEERWECGRTGAGGCQVHDGCPGAAWASCSLSVAPPALAPPHRDVRKRDLPEAGALSPTHPQLIHGKLGDGTVVSLPQRPNLGPST